MRVLVLVVSSQQEPWRTVEQEGQRLTWAATTNADVPVLFYYGAPAGLTARGSGALALGLRMMHARRVRGRLVSSLARRYVRRPVRREESRIWTGVPDNLVYINARQRAALRHVIATERFEFVLRTNVSSYVHLDGLRAYASALPRTGYYGGYIDHSLEASDGVSFVSGAGVLMSRDVAEAAAYDEAWEYDRGDDIALGFLMHRLGIKCAFIPRIDVAHPDERLDARALQRCFLVRCKSQTSRSLDVDIMHRVHAAYLKVLPSSARGEPHSASDNRSEYGPSVR